MSLQTPWQKEKMLDAGYFAYRSHGGWYYCKQLPKLLPICECNDKCVQLVVFPYDETVEVEISGERNKIWYKLQSYAVLREHFLRRLPEIEAQLIAAWGALK